MLQFAGLPRIMELCRECNVGAIDNELEILQEILDDGKERR